MLVRLSSLVNGLLLPENSTFLLMCKPGSSQLETPVPKKLLFRYSVNGQDERPTSSRDLGPHVLTVRDGMRWDEMG